MVSGSALLLTARSRLSKSIGAESREVKEMINIAPIENVLKMALNLYVEERDTLIYFIHLSTLINPNFYQVPLLL